jgi:hypothetical protein
MKAEVVTYVFELACINIPKSEEKMKAYFPFKGIRNAPD